MVRGDREIELLEKAADTDEGVDLSAEEVRCLLTYINSLDAEIAHLHFQAKAVSTPKREDEVSASTAPFTQSQPEPRDTADTTALAPKQ